MKNLCGSLLLVSALMLSGCGGEESNGNIGTAPAPGTEVPTQTTTMVVPLPAEGVSDPASPASDTAAPSPASSETGTAAPSPAASPAN